jgi:DNA-binding NtrC family response regulator
MGEKPDGGKSIGPVTIPGGKRMDASLNSAYTTIFPVLTGPFESSAEARGRQRILLVDPDTARSSVLKWLLEADGHCVAQSFSYWAALEEAGFGGYDLTMVSHQESGFNALRFIEGLRKLKPAMPALLIHSDKTKQLSTQAARLGVLECFGNPIDYERIQRLVRRLAGYEGFRRGTDCF